MSGSAAPFRLGILNPNTSPEVTEVLDRHARRVARVGTTVVTLRPTHGPAAVEGWSDAYRSVPGMLDRLVSLEHPLDALVLAGFGDVGLEALREVLAVPVLDMTEIGAATARSLGRRYGVVTTLAAMVDPIRSSLSVRGLTDRNVGVEPIDVGIAEAAVAEVVLPRLIDAAKQLVDHGAEAVCLGSAVLLSYAATLCSEVGVPVVDPLAAAIALLETAYLPDRAGGPATGPPRSD
ncbi:MAG: Asp/Glu/hydantoin racemase [Acidobacteriota bacterium]|nr:Asp/Glu/hydantoin racemase [Acidobacteriota bacterium]